jgi:hypothetical protein
MLGRPEGASTSSASPTAESTAPPFDLIDPRIPTASRARVARLVALTDEIAAAADTPLLAPAHTEARQTRLVHLPRLLQSYIDIPAAHRSELFRRTGQSASFVLNEGLDQMITRMEAISHSIAQDDIAAFTDNLHFIKARYGDRDPFA